MASYERVIQFETEKKPGVIRLVESNGFYRAYNHSAFLFHSCIARHKVTRKFIKNLDRAVIYTGFPTGKLLERIDGREHEKTELGYDVFLREDEIPDDAGYEEWKEKVPVEAASRGDFHSLPPAGDELYRAVCARLRDFPVETKTLIESVAFLCEMKKALLEGKGAG